MIQVLKYFEVEVNFQFSGKSFTLPHHIYVGQFGNQNK